MSDVATTNGNGTVKYRLSVWAISIALLASLFLEGALGIGLMYHPPQDWSLLKDLLTHLFQLDGMLVAGLFAVTRPQGS